MQPSASNKKRLPQLKHTTLRNIGWHVSYRDAESGQPKKHRFGNVSAAEARQLYNAWLAKFLVGELPGTGASKPKAKDTPKSDIVRGSLFHIASNLLTYEESRVRPESGERRANTITRKQFDTRADHVCDFLQYIDFKRGAGEAQEPRSG